MSGAVNRRLRPPLPEETFTDVFGEGEAEQLTLPFSEHIGEGLLRQGPPRPAIHGPAHLMHSAGNSKAMLPRAALRKSSRSRWAMRAVSPEV